MWDFPVTKPFLFFVTNRCLGSILRVSLVITLVKRSNVCVTVLVADGLDEGLKGCERMLTIKTYLYSSFYREP